MSNASLPGQSQRSTRAEREAVREALQAIWENASEQSQAGLLVEFTFPATSEGCREGRSLYDSLLTFRKRTERRKLEQFHLWTKINSLMLCKSKDCSRVYFKRKAGEASGRSLVVLNAAARLERVLGEAQGVRGASVDCPIVRVD